MIKIEIVEENADILYINYLITIGDLYFSQFDYIFRDNMKQLFDFHVTLESNQFLNLIVNRCKFTQLGLLKYCIQNNIKLNPIIEINDQYQKQITQLIKESTQNSIEQSYEIANSINSELRKMIFLHQIIMVDTYMQVDDKINNLQKCIDFIKNYKSTPNIEQYLNQLLQFMLNDKYRLQSSIMRKDLCQQTLLELQQISNKNIILNNSYTKLLKIQLDLLQADYVYSIQKKVSINVNTFVEIMNKFKIIDIYDNSMKLHQIPVVMDNEGNILYRIDDYLSRFVQIIYGALQLQEVTLFGEELAKLQNYFNKLANIQVRYVYHLCLSQCVDKTMALENSLKAFELAIEINDLDDIIEIFINTQLIFIEVDQCLGGIKFTQQFLDNFGEQSRKYINYYLEIKLQFREQYKIIQDNLTYMSIALQT